MKRIGLAGLAAVMSFSAPVWAGSIDGDAVIGGALGGAAGAAVGSAVGGRNGAIVGGAVGGAAGVAIATDGKKEVVKTRKETVYVEEHHHDDHDHGLHKGH